MNKFLTLMTLVAVAVLSANTHAEPITLAVIASVAGIAGGVVTVGNFVGDAIKKATTVPCRKENLDCNHERYWCKFGSLASWSHHCSRCVVGCKAHGEDKTAEWCASHYAKECNRKPWGVMHGHGSLKRDGRGCFYQGKGKSLKYALPLCPK